MNKKFTKKEARELFNARRDADLARALNMTPQALYHYSDDDFLSENMHWKIRALIAEQSL